MLKINWNEGWRYRRLPDTDWITITLPHDAAMNEARVHGAESGVNGGWYLGADYEYEKIFSASEELLNQDIFLEFEGVYHNAEVWLNDMQIAFRPYGYTNFYVNLHPYLRYGEKNIIRVIARNSDQPNCRWYSGAGIYRPVWLYIGEKQRIRKNGVKIRTVSIAPAEIEISVKTTGDGEASIVVYKEEYTESKTGIKVAEARGKVESGEALFRLTIPEASLWSPEFPVLYTCHTTFGTDEVDTTFGIRMISCDPLNGLCINGKRVILRGACIHHDNGILGARCFPEAEERKVRLLREYGYNAIRSAHNPCSKALLEACDRYGMLVMDEYVDMWYIHKNKYDYADDIMKWYATDIHDMIDKDFNHPSVILYSLGNEVAETGEARGIGFFKAMKEICKEFDPDRLVTAGVNIFFNYLYSIGLGQYSDEKAEKNPEKKVGSEFFNHIAGIFGDEFMKTMAKLPGCDRKTRDCFREMDVAGYNYGIKRYARDLRKYPDRVILGSETFCSDAFDFWEFAKKNKALIGDFVWAGMDYLGEVGVGAWEYRDYAPDYHHGIGWVSAGSGRLDLIGNPLGEAFYTKVAFELEDKPQIAVVPVNHTDERHSPSAWKFSNAISSWSWNGCNGKSESRSVFQSA